jgi:hypothetical protein
MEIDKREQEQRDWKGYGSAEAASSRHLLPRAGRSRSALAALDERPRYLGPLGDQATFELHLAARYRSVELVGSGKVIVKSADQMAILAEGAQEIKAPDDSH